MNIRFSPSSIRIRLSQIEANELVERGLSCQRIFLDGEVSTEMRVSLHTGADLEWRVRHDPESKTGAWACNVPRDSFKELLSDSQIKDALIRSQIRLSNGGSVDISIEIDRWGQAKRSRAQS